MSDGGPIILRDPANVAAVAVTPSEQETRIVVHGFPGTPGAGGVTSVNGKPGPAVTLDAADVGADAAGAADTASAGAVAAHVAQADPHPQYAEKSSLGAVATTNNYADLNNLPDLSVYDDVQSFVSEAAFPATGSSGDIYIALDTNLMYRWNGSGYTQVSGKAPVWGQVTGTLADQSDLAGALAAKEPTITAGTASQYRRGDKTWASFAGAVLASALTGLSTATNMAITATDTVVVAFGKAQAQLAALISGKVDKAAGMGLSTNDFSDAEKSKVDSALQSVVAGTNVTVDATDPHNPVVSASGGTVTSVNNVAPDGAGNVALGDLANMDSTAITQPFGVDLGNDATLVFGPDGVLLINVARAAGAAQAVIKGPNNYTLLGTAGGGGPYLAGSPYVWLGNPSFGRGYIWCSFGYGGIPCAAVLPDPNQTTQVGFEVRRAQSAQTAHLQNWSDEAGNVLSYIDAAGNIITPNLGTASAKDINVANGVPSLGADAKILTTFLPASVLGQVSYEGGWDASAGSAPSATPTKGWYYIVTTAGSTSLGGITDWKVGDWAIYDGTQWDKVDNTDAVSSVAGLVGPISAASLQTALSLGSAAYTASSAYATAGQGSLASTALQPGAGLGAIDSAANTKLSGIAAGAEVNVQPDWTATTGDAEILNKPDLTGIAVNHQTGTAYTAVAADAGKEIWMDNAAANTLTIDPSVFSANVQILVRQYGAGQTTVVASGANVLKKYAATSKLAGQYARGCVAIQSATELFLNGELAAS